MRWVANRWITLDEEGKSFRNIVDFVEEYLTKKGVEIEHILSEDDLGEPHREWTYSLWIVTPDGEEHPITIGTYIVGRDRVWIKYYSKHKLIQEIEERLKDITAEYS